MRPLLSGVPGLLPGRLAWFPLLRVLLLAPALRRAIFLSASLSPPPLLPLGMSQSSPGDFGPMISCSEQWHFLLGASQREEWHRGLPGTQAERPGLLLVAAAIAVGRPASRLLQRGGWVEIEGGLIAAMADWKAMGAR